MKYNVYKVHTNPLYSASPNNYFHWYTSSNNEMQIRSKMVKLWGSNLVTSGTMHSGILTTHVGYLASEISAPTLTPTPQKKATEWFSLSQMPALFYSLLLV